MASYNSGGFSIVFISSDKAFLTIRCGKEPGLQDTFLDAHNCNCLFIRESQQWTCALCILDQRLYSNEGRWQQCHNKYWTQTFFMIDKAGIYSLFWECCLYFINNLSLLKRNRLSMHWLSSELWGARVGLCIYTAVNLNCSVKHGGMIQH